MFYSQDESVWNQSLYRTVNLLTRMAVNDREMYNISDNLLNIMHSLVTNKTLIHGRKTEG